MKITTGPCFEGNIKKRCEFNDYGRFINLEDIICEPSEFTGLVNYKNLCDYCIHDRFIKK